MLILQRKMMSRPIILLLLDQCAQLTFSAMALLYVNLDWGIHANIVSVTCVSYTSFDLMLNSRNTFVNLFLSSLIQVS